ncbi:hypothetical protein D1872_309680 [compost metagenome]
MEPFLRFSQILLACVTGEASVNPYPSISFPPDSDSNRDCTSRGSDAAPLMHTRIEDKSYRPMSG